MKRCHTCGEEFASQFSFCPIDGTVLGEIQRVLACEYRVTLISERSLAQRLVTEGQFLFDSVRRAWPRFKSSPTNYTWVQLRLINEQARQIVTRPYVAASLLTAISIILAVTVGAILFDRRGHRTANVGEPDEDLVPSVTLDLRNDVNANSNPGIGAGEKGRVGFENGSGEGSGARPARAQGGGGGGNLAQLPQSQGRLPVTSVIPAPISTTYARLPQTLPEAGINIDPVLWKDFPFRDYGDPRAKSNVASNGPGNGGGVGTGQGPGVGEGNGPGVGPGSKGNMGGGENGPGCCGKGGATGNNPNVDMDRVFNPAEVNTRARVLSKPEPQYTEEARRNQISGTVVLSVVFSRTGQVTNIRAVQTLCCGLTEKAIAAARMIRFAPASKDGVAVSTRMQLEYNFNLY